MLVARLQFLEFLILLEETPTSFLCVCHTLLRTQEINAREIVLRDARSRRPLLHEFVQELLGIRLLLHDALPPRVQLGKLRGKGFNLFRVVKPNDALGIRVATVRSPVALARLPVHGDTATRPLQLCR